SPGAHGRASLRPATPGYGFVAALRLGFCGINQFPYSTFGQPPSFPKIVVHNMRPYLALRENGVKNRSEMER
ncbi:MAG: hypothetical protein LAT67_15825, partial [Balneolales bacterium]|nr:hypothetical protein [Balneolales bacterium]